VLAMWLKAPKVQWHAGKPDPYSTPAPAGAPQVYKGKRGNTAVAKAAEK
jgi:hypothetical protein